MEKINSRARNYLIAASVAVVLVCGIIFVSCVSQPSQGAIQTAIAETQGAAPTASDTPTTAPTPTRTPSPTRPPTNTPLPPETLTAKAIENTATREAYLLTSTVELRDKRATEIASYQSIDWRELTTYPDNHTGEFVRISGRVFNVVDNETIQLFISGTQEGVYISMRDPFTGLYANDTITVYGMVFGAKCFTNTLGGQVCQPYLIDAFYQK